jgi:hypothetical protein
MILYLGVSIKSEQSPAKFKSFTHTVTPTQEWFVVGTMFTKAAFDMMSYQSLQKIAKRRGIKGNLGKAKITTALLKWQEALNSLHHRHRSFCGKENHERGWSTRFGEGDTVGFTCSECPCSFVHIAEQ